MHKIERFLHPWDRRGGVVACGGGLRNPLAHLFSKQLQVPRDRVEELLLLLQSNILDPGSVSPLLELLIG